MTVYWVVWDAAAHWMAQRLIRDGALPALSHLRATGMHGAARPPHPNCQTPPSLATLFTGTAPAQHGITGFSMPDPAGAPGAQVAAFGRPLRHPPVWERVAAAGLRSAFVHVPWVFRADGTLPPWVDGAVEAYSRRLARAQVVPVPPGRRAARWTVGDRELEGVPDGPGVVIHGGGRRTAVPPDGGWVAVPLGDTGIWVRLAAAGPRRLLLQTGAWSPRTGGADVELLAGLRRAPVFAGEGLGAHYRTGTLGPRLIDGGDGVAEELFVSSVDRVHRSFAGAAAAVLQHSAAHLVVVYLPMIDEVGHEWAGWCDGESSAYRADVAARLWTLLRRCWAWADDVLADVLARAGPHDTVVLSADHGMVGTTHTVHLNQALVAAGLATVAADGGVDAERSPAYYHPANNGSLWAGPGTRSQATVDAPALQAAAARLSRLTAPGTGVPLVRGFVDEHGAALDPNRLGSAVTCSVVLTDDFQPSAEMPPDGEVVRPAAKSGAHVVNTGSARLHAVFAAAGPGLPAGADLGIVGNTLPAQVVIDQLTP